MRTLQDLDEALFYKLVTDDTEVMLDSVRRERDGGSERKETVTRLPATKN